MKKAIFFVLFAVGMLSVNVHAQTLLPLYYSKQATQKFRSNKLLNEIRRLQRDSSGNEHTDSLQIKQLNADKDNSTYGTFFPTIQNPDMFRSQKTSFLGTNNLTYNDSLSNISMYSELAADYFGPVRVSIGTTLSFPKSDTSSPVQQKLNRDKFIQRFATGGGGLVFNFSLPVYTYPSDLFTAAITLSPKFSLEPPSFGVSTKSFANNSSLGVDMQAGLTGVEDLISFFGYTRFAYTMGNSSFYDALQLTGNNRKAFWLNTYTIGVNVKNLFSISYQKFFGTSNIADRLSGYLTFTISPNFK